MYSGSGLRRPFAVDFLVSSEIIDNILEIFEKLGVVSKVNRPKRFLSVESPLEFWSSGPLDVSLSWRVFPSIASREEADLLWGENHFAKSAELKATVLGYELLFLRGCLRFVRAVPQFAYFSMIDLAFLLRNHSDEVNWEQVMIWAHQYHLVSEVKYSLAYLQNAFGITSNQAFVTSLEEYKLTAIDNFNYKILKSHKPALFYSVAGRLLRYSKSPRIPSRIRFLRYLQYVWGWDGLYLFPRLTAKKILARFMGKR